MFVTGESITFNEKNLITVTPKYLPVNARI
jgi:hypothetical protein